MASRIAHDFSELDLKSYVEGSAPEELQMAILKAVDADENLAERIAALDPWAGAVKGAVQALPIDQDIGRISAALVNAVARTGGSVPPRSSGDRTGWAILASVGALAAILAGIVAWSIMSADKAAPPAPPVQQPKPATEPPKPAGPQPDLIAGQPVSPPSWLQAVADYVKLMTPQTLSLAAQNPEQLERSLAAANSASGLKLESLVQRFPDLKLQRAEILELNGRPLVQLAFLDAANEVVAICVLTRKARPDGLPENTRSPLKSAALANLNVVSWDYNTHGFLVIGKATDNALRQLANSASSTL
jgi:hypothetical protein